jgi:hypothetical protein
MREREGRREGKQEWSDETGGEIGKRREEGERGER